MKLKLGITLLILVLSVFSQINLFAKSKKYDLKEIEKTVQILSKRLRSSNTAVRVDAIRKLADLNHKKTLKPLFFALHDPNTFVRKNACVALGKLKYFEAVNPLIRLVKKESNNFVLREAIRSLGNIGDERARWVLKKLTKHSSLMIRREAKIALSKLTKGVNPF